MVSIHVFKPYMCCVPARRSIYTVALFLQVYLCGVYECLLVVLLPTGEQHSIVRAPGQQGNTLTVALYHMLLERLRSLGGGKTKQSLSLDWSHIINRLH